MRDAAVGLLKFTPPALPAGFVPRARLFDVVSRGLCARLALVHAPAGYGKSTLLSSVAQQWNASDRRDGPRRVAWYQLDGSENDPAIFIEGLVESVRRVMPGFGLPTLLALGGVQDATLHLDRLLQLFVDDLERSGDGEIALVLDDFHTLTNTAILEAIERHFLARRSPVRLAISSRSDPPLYLAGLRSRSEMVELTAEQLSFTPAEVRELVRLRVGIDAGEPAVEAVIRGTKGWPSFAAVSALLVRMTEGGVPAGRLAPTEYNHARLVSQLVRLLPREKQPAVLRSSLLPFLDAATCAHQPVMGQANGLLTFIRESGLPATSPATADAPLRYDALFRSALQRELESSLPREEYRALQREAAAYCEARGEWQEAVRRYLEAGDAESAAGVVERFAERELSAGHYDAVLEWIRLLPAPARRSHPGLMVEEARLLLARNRLDEARALLATAKIELRSRGDEVGEARRLGAWALLLAKEGLYADARRSVVDALAMLPDRTSTTSGELLLLLSGILDRAGDLALAYDTAAEALLVFERAGRQREVAETLMQLGRLAHGRGLPREALALSARAVSWARAIGRDVVSLAMLGGVASSAYLDQGRFREAASVADGSLEIAERLRSSAARVRSLLSLSAALDRLGRAQDAWRPLQQAVDSCAASPECSPERTLALMAEAAYLLRRGRSRPGVEKARQAVRKAEACGHLLLLEESRLVAVAGEPAGIVGPPQLLFSLRRLSGAFRAQGNLRWYSAAQLLTAQAEHRLGRRGPAREAMERYTQLATEQGYAGLPLGLPVDGQRLLDLFIRESFAPDLAPAILSAIEEPVRVALRPFLKDSKPEIRARAERILEVAESGQDRAPVRSIWPALQSGGVEREYEVYLRALGEFQPFVGGSEAHWASGDARLLAAYLLVHRNEPIPREQVMVDLWPDLDRPAANLRLHVALYTLAESLGPGYPRIDPDSEWRGYILWEGVGCRTDVDEFVEGVDRARGELEEKRLPVLSQGVLSRLQSAANLYGGEFLADVDFDWTRPLREDLRARLLWATRLLVSHFVALRAWPEAVRYGLQSLRSDPLQEDVVRDLMLSYYYLRDRDAVLHQYRELKRLLARDRGEWPSEETRLLRLRLLGR